MILPSLRAWWVEPQTIVGESKPALEWPPSGAGRQPAPDERHVAWPGPNWSGLLESAGGESTEECAGPDGGETGGGFDLDEPDERESGS
jgi:hypothetical protein